MQYQWLYWSKFIIMSDNDSSKNIKQIKMAQLTGAVQYTDCISADR